MNEVDQFTKKFTDDRLSNVIQLKKDFFEAHSNLLKIVNKVDKEPFAIGTYLGGGKPFHPSMILLDWLNDRTDRHVTVDKKSAWLFVCGRDAFAQSIIAQSTNHGPVLVRNDEDEVLGYGKLTGRKIAVKNILDRGDFLRRE